MPIKTGTISRLDAIRRKLIKLAPNLVVFIMVAALYLSGGLQFVENKLTDLRFQLIQSDAGGDLVIVEIDPDSLQEIYVWPWPRGLYAVALDKLLDAGARRVAFNIDFSSPSVTEEDQMLQRALGQSGGKVILPMFKQLTEDAENGREFALSFPIPEFSESAQLAFINVRPETDGLIRRMSVRESWYKQQIPSLPFLLTEDTDFGFDSFFIDYGIRIDTIPRISFIDVLRGTYDASSVAGKQVIIGATAIELGNQLAVPVHHAVSGTLVQAMAYESLSQGRALLAMGPAPIIAAMLLITLFVMPRFNEWSWRRGLVMVALTCVPLLPLPLAVQYFTPLMVDVTPLVLLVSISYVVALARRIDQQGLRLMFQGVEIRRRDVMMRNVVANSFDGIITMDENGLIESVNPSALQLFEYRSDQVLNHHISMVFSKLGENDNNEELFRFLRVGQGPHEIEGRDRDGRVFPMEAEVTEIFLGDRRVLTVFIRDITERNNLKRELERNALYDTLTNIPNRTLFFNRLDHAISSAQRSHTRFALLLVDLDNFKGINDSLGHYVGDLLLKQVSQRFQCQVRESDTVARLGGDEFVFLLPEISETETACQLSAKILKSLEQPFSMKDYKLDISASIGIAVYPEHGDEATLLVQSADQAMYAAKHEQSGIAIYSPETDKRKVQHMTLVDDLRSVIDEGQLSLYYQPKVDLWSNQIKGVEALVRWPHKERGFLLPDDFIGTAEQTGLIKSLTVWVLDAAIKQCAQWRNNGFDIDVAVNLSAHLLQDLKLPEMVDQILRKNGLSAGNLALEITESAVMVDPVRAKTAIKLLKECGVRISIDDFGTGYSSLAYLNNLSADELKIDKGFVINMNEEMSNKIIVESTIGLAHNLGLTVVAEGIETRETCEQLTALGCDFGQGYLFGHPLPVEDITRRLTESLQGQETVLGDDKNMANKLII